MQIHAQRHGGVLLVGRDDGLPLRGPVLAQPLQPPGRVVAAGHRVGLDGGQQCLTLTQKAAQTGVDEARLACHGATLGRFHRLVHQGEGRIGRAGFVPGQGQGRAQQRIERRGRGARGQLLAQRLRPPQLAQHLKQQRLHARAQAGRHGGQGCAAGVPSAHGLQGLGGGAQLLPQRRRAGRD